jgi:putative transposase
MKNQKMEILSFVETERQKGRAVDEILRTLRVSKTSYYRWIKKQTAPTDSALKIESTRSVTDIEKERILAMKAANPEMRHRQIQGMLQLEGHYLSPTSVYKELKSHDLVEPYERRAAPWKEPFYEIYRANVMWGADWTKLRIGGVRWYLLTMIDFFSRMIIHHEIVPTVNASHIKRLYRQGLENFDIPMDWHLKPELRVDQGSPNTAKVTKDFFKDIQADLSFARVRRPTDNALTERFYRTIKQEEIYVVGDYQDEATAKDVIGEYIKWYNEKRPHQALWNFTPWLVHETNNKTEFIKALKELKQKTWKERREYWMENKKRN